MANRAALRELQQRLASRLQAARGQEQSVSWLAVVAGGSRYLFPLTQADEIFPSTQVQPVPYAQPWFIGVANLRGGLFGVVDLAHFVGGKAKAPAAPGTPSEGSFVTLNAALEVNCAILIEQLAGLRGVESFKASHEAPAGSPEFFGHLYVDADGVRWQELNLQLLSQSPSFLGIGV
ncbi:MAG: chemotaxis protein CheW [Burkholderiales bacterium]